MNTNWSSAGNMIVTTFLGDTMVLAAPHTMVLKSKWLEDGSVDGLAVKADKAVVTITDRFASHVYHVVDVRYDLDGEYEFLAINRAFMPTPLPAVPYANLVRSAIGGQSCLKGDVKAVQDAYKALRPFLEEAEFPGCSAETLMKGASQATAATWRGEDSRRSVGRQTEAEKVVERLRDIVKAPSIDPIEGLTDADVAQGIVNVLREAGIDAKIGYDNSVAEEAEIDALLAEISALNEQLDAVRADNDTLKEALGVVEEEEVNLEGCACEEKWDGSHDFLADAEYQGEHVTVFYADRDPMHFDRIVEIEDFESGELMLTDIYGRFIIPRRGFLYIITEEITESED